MDTASRAADSASLGIHYAIESGDKSGLHQALDEVHAYEATHHSSDKEFQSHLNKDLQDVLPQMSLMWAQDHQSGLVRYSDDSGSITRQGIADYEMSNKHDPNQNPIDQVMADSLRQNWDKYSNQGDGRTRSLWDYVCDNNHLNSADINAALAPMQSNQSARMAVSELAQNQPTDDSLFRKLSQDGDGKEITPDSLHHALANQDLSFMNDRQRASAQYLADHYADFDKYNGGTEFFNPGVYQEPVSGMWEGSMHQHDYAPITPGAINQYAEIAFNQPADQIVQNTEKAEQVTAGTSIPQPGYSADETGRTGDEPGQRRERDNYACDGTPPAVPQQMYADASVQTGEGFYQAAQRMLGTDAPSNEVLGLAHQFKSEYARDNNEADPSDLPIGYNFLDGYNKDDWSYLTTKYPSLQKRTNNDDCEN